MLTLLNIGNTHTQIGQYTEGEIELIETIPTSELDIKKFPAEKTAAASVVPEFSAMLKKCGAFLVESQNCGLDFSLVDATTIGGDRLANAARLATIGLLPGVVVDFGTAITFEVVNKKRQFIGGAILPGRAMQRKALSVNTAQLPQIEISKFPPQKIGNNTADAIALGVDVGTIGGIKEILKIISGQLGCEFSLVGTGGDAPYFLPFFEKMINGGDDFTLRGVACCLENYR